MNRLIVAALILSPLVARAWEPLQGALSLDFGGCWIRPENPGPRWKIVSFGDRVASNYGANEFQQLLDPSITTILRSAFESFPATSAGVSQAESTGRSPGAVHSQGSGAMDATPSGSGGRASAATASRHPTMLAESA